MTREEAIAAFAAELQSPDLADVQAAFLFGSAAEARMHRESDVDLAVLLDRSARPTARDRFERRLVLMARLGACVPGRTLEVVSLEDLPPQFARRIVTQGIRIHSTSAERTHAFVRDVQLRAADLEPFLRRARATKLERLLP